MTELTIQIPDNTEPDQIIEQLSSAIKAATSDERSDLDISIDAEEITHPKWEKGQPCPECGSPTITEIHIDTEIARVEENGLHSFQGDGDRLATIGYECLDCREKLYWHPALSLVENTS